MDIGLKPQSVLCYTDNVDETWNSGQKASRDKPVWVEIDLGATHNIQHLDLLPYQVPTPARTVHKIYVGDTKSSMELAMELDGETRHHYAIKEVPINKTGRYLRVETVESPSWVAWSNIKIFGNKSA